MRLTALNQRLTPMVEGKVIYLSADAVGSQHARTKAEQEAPQRPSYVVRVRLR